MSEESPYRAIKVIRDLNVPNLKECISKQFPFDEMEAGHKFSIERPKEETELSSKAEPYWKNRTMHNIQSHITRYKKSPENKHKIFALRYTEDENGIHYVTCWRIDGIELLEEDDSI